MRPTRPSKTPRLSRGFTLVETLVAILLILALSGAVTSFVWGVITSRDRAATSARESDDWSRLVSLVQGAMLTSCAQGTDGVFGGGATSVKIPCRVLHLTPDGVGGGGGGSLGVTFRRATHEIVVHRGPESEVAVHGVGDVSIRYWDGRSWSESFDASSAGTLPGAIELSVWMEDLSPDPADQESLDAPRRGPDRWRIFAVPDGRVDPLAGGAP